MKPSAPSPAADIRIARSPTASTFNPDEIRRIVALGKERGFIKAPGQARARIDKDGLDAAGLGNVRSQWMDVGPELAQRWLTNNFGNRPLRHDTVEAYARDMRNGVWVPTHQGVAFNDQDQLIDGQHRLRAILLAGVTIRLMVTFGLPSKIEGHEMTTMDAVDRGRPRSVGDQLGIQHGLNNGSITASICAAIASLCYGERTRRLSVGQTLDVFRAFEPAVLYVIEHRSRAPGLRTTGVLAGIAFALMTETEFAGSKRGPVSSLPETRQKIVAAGAGTTLARLFGALNSGEGLKARSAVSKLREFLISDEAKLFTRSLDRGLAEMVLQALHLELTGQSVTKLHAGNDGAEWFRGRQRDRVEKIATLFRLPGTKHKDAKAA